MQLSSSTKCKVCEVSCQSLPSTVPRLHQVTPLFSLNILWWGQFFNLMVSPEVSCFRFDMRVWWKASANWWFQPFLGFFGVSGLISSFPDLDCSCGLATTLFGSTRCTRALLATFSVLSRDGVMEVTVPPRFPCWCSYSRFSTKHCDATFTKCINALRGGLDWETDTLHLAVPHMCCFLLLLCRFYMNSR